MQADLEAIMDAQHHEEYADAEKQQVEKFERLERKEAEEAKRREEAQRKEEQEAQHKEEAQRKEEELRHKREISRHEKELAATQAKIDCDSARCQKEEQVRVDAQIQTLRKELMEKSCHELEVELEEARARKVICKAKETQQGEEDKI